LLVVAQEKAITVAAVELAVIYQEQKILFQQLLTP
jgi:hypothetical protein